MDNIPIREVPTPIFPDYNINLNQTFNYNNNFNNNINNTFNNNNYNNDYIFDFPNNNNIFNNNINKNNNNNFAVNNINNNNHIINPPFIHNQNKNQNKKKKIVKNLTLPNFNQNTIEPLHTINIPTPIINHNKNLIIPKVPNQNQNIPQEPTGYFQCKKIFGTIKPIENYLTEGNVIIHNKQVPVNQLKNQIILRKKFKINIIYFDKNLTSTENNRYCSYFKLQLEGAFYGINNFNLFIYICHKIQQNKRNF